MGAYDEEDEQNNFNAKDIDENQSDIEIKRQEGEIEENTDEVTTEELMENYNDLKDN